MIERGFTCNGKNIEIVILISNLIIRIRTYNWTEVKMKATTVVRIVGIRSSEALLVSGNVPRPLIVMETWPLSRGKKECKQNKSVADQIDECIFAEKDRFEASIDLSLICVSEKENLKKKDTSMQ